MIYAKRLNESGTRTLPCYSSNTWNAYAETDARMPNCTAYAFGRSSEIYGANIRNFVMFNRKGGGNANQWFSTTLWEKGKKPKVGAIACWDGDLGHVAVVEEVINDETIVVSQSNYGGTYFEVKTYNAVVGQITKGVGLVFQGYIYNPNAVSGITERAEGKEQVEVIADMLRIRKQPNGEIAEGLYCERGVFNVLETKVAGAYTWARIDEGIWIALNEGNWTRYFGAEAKKEPEFEGKAQELIDCLSRIESLKKGLADARADYIRISREIEESIL